MLPARPDWAGLDVALVGVPMDLGVTNRPGARFGPRAVRGIERIGPYHHVHEIAPLTVVKCADVGDVPFRSRFSLSDSHEDIEAFYKRLAAAGVSPVSVGGDHSISLPILKALGAGRPLGLVHIDAHGDTSGPFEGAKFHHGGPFRQAVLAGVLDPERTIQIGIRGGAEYLWEFSYASGMTVIHADEVSGLGIERIIQKIGAGRRQGANLRLLRHRQPRSGLRAGHGHPGDRRPEHARGPGPAAGLRRAGGGRRRRRGGRSPVRRDHQYRPGRRPDAVRDLVTRGPDPHAGQAGGLTAAQSRPGLPPSAGAQCGQGPRWRTGEGLHS